MVEVLTWFVANRTRPQEYISIVPVNIAGGQNLDESQSCNSDSNTRMRTTLTGNPSRRRSACRAQAQSLVQHYVQ